MLIRLLFYSGIMCALKLDYHAFEACFIYRSFLYESILRAQDRLIFMPTREANI